jgi:hypothetical protein
MDARRDSGPSPAARISARADGLKPKSLRFAQHCVLSVQVSVEGILNVGEMRCSAYWWRPGGMYLNLYLWLHYTMLTPVPFKLAL